MGVKMLDFEDKRNPGKRVQGLKVVMAKPASEPEFDGYGYVIFDLKDMSTYGMHFAAEFVAKCKDLWLQEVSVSCVADLSGRFPRFLPRDIAIVD